MRHRTRRPRHHLLGRTGDARATAGGHRPVRPGVRRLLRAVAVGRRRRGGERHRQHHDRRRHRRSDDGGGRRPATPSQDDAIELRFSTTEILRNKDFAAYSPDELSQAHELMSHLRLVGAPRASLRRATEPPAAPFDPTSDARCDRRSGPGANRSNATSPTPSPRLRRLVLLLDVSGSMEPYARALLRFVHAAVAGRQKVEAFTLGTRLTRITRELSSRDPDIALRAAGQRVARLERRHPAGQRPARVQRRVGRARSRPQLDRRHPVRRLGPRRPRRA